MRIFLLIYLTCLLAKGLISQNLNVAEHLGVDKSGELVSINSKSYYLSTTEQGCYSSVASLVCINDSGRILAKHSFGTYGLTFFGRLIKTKDNALMFNGASTSSTDTGPYENLVVKMDTNGTVLFQYTQPAGDFYPEILGITQHADSSYYLSGKYGITHLSKSGQSLPFSISGFIQNSAVIALTNGNILFHGMVNSSLRKNVIVTPTGSIITQQTCSNRIIKFVEYPNYILALTSAGSIEKYASNMSLQSSSALALNPLNYQIKDFTTRNDSIFVCGTTANNQNPFYAVLDSIFTINYQTTAVYKGIKPTGISITKRNTIHIVTTSSTEKSPLYTFTSVYRFKLTGTFHSTSDVGVIGFSNVNAHMFGNGSSGSWLTPYMEMDVTVKNFGTDTVESFYINHYVFMGGISYCYLLLHKKVQTLLAPGATMTVPTGTFYGQPGVVFQSGGDPAQRKGQVCLFTSVPNQNNDRDMSNDAFCDTLVFTFTGIETNNLFAGRVEVFPNPFQNTLTLKSDVEIKNLEVRNALGEQQLKLELTSKELDLNLENLSSGVYFMRVETEKGFLTKKMIKE